MSSHKQQVMDFSLVFTEETIGLWLSTACETTRRTVAVAAKWLYRDETC